MSDTAVSVVKILKGMQSPISVEKQTSIFSEEPPQTEPAIDQTTIQVSLDVESKALLKALLVELQLQNDIALKKMELENLKEQDALEHEKQAEQEDKARFEKVRSSLYL